MGPVGRDIMNTNLSVREEGRRAPWFRVGLTGVCVTAVCCFTPALVVVLGALGFSAWLAWLDFVLLPALAIFLAMAVYGWSLRGKRRAKDARS